MSIPKDGYYMAKVQLDTGGMCPHYVRVKDGKPYSQWGDELLPEACSEFQEVNTTLMVRVWPEDAAMELEALRSAGLVERVSGCTRPDRTPSTTSTGSIGTLVA